MNRCTLPLFSTLLFVTACSAWANVRMPGIFGDHMVLQQDMRIPVWGWADPGEAVTVALGSEKGAATAGPDGKWRVDLPPSPTQGTAEVLTVAGKNTLTFQDVLVGEVWLFSGQSNMEFPLKLASHAATEVPQATDTQIRLFLVPRRRAFTPLDDTHGFPEHMFDGKSNRTDTSFGANPGDDTLGVWVACSPDKAAPFSAVAYFFGKELRQKFNRPVGLIGSYWGGSPGEAWVSADGLNADPVLQARLGSFKNLVALFSADNDHIEDRFAEATQARQKWDADMAADPRTPAFKAASKAWWDAVPGLQAAHQPLPPAPQPPIPQPPDPNGFAATLLYNGMIAPLMPYAIRGAVWYQGESDTNSVQQTSEYRPLLARLISTWRSGWNEGAFPFLIVQLANNNPRPKNPDDPTMWALLRESQMDTLAIPNTGIATAIDLGMATSIHPPDKADLAHRLSLTARSVAYGEDVLDSGPTFRSMRIDGSRIYLAFDHVGLGLTIGQSHFTSPDVPPPPTDQLRGFAIAGPDHQWYWADAKIAPDGVIVSSGQVATPIAVRYAWADNPVANLYNKDGLPAMPFRTDDWP